MFNKIDERHKAHLRTLVEHSRIAFGEQIGQDYSHDELEGVHAMPEVLIKVKTAQEVSGIMAYANEHSIPVVVRGSGTGLVGAAVAVHGGIMIDMTAMKAVLQLDKRNMCITVQPGILLMELAAYVTEHGLFYPPDPGEKSATIGGNISTNAGGMRAVRYGVTRDYVRGLNCVMPDGRIEHFGGKIAKNSSGYSIKDLIIGSEGTLAIIVEATLRLLPMPKESVSLLVPFTSFRKAISAVPEIMLCGDDPTAVEFMTSGTVALAERFLGKRFPKTGSDAALLLTFDGSDKQSLKERYESTGRRCMELGALDAFIVDTDERKEVVWSARGAFLEAIKADTSEMDECDVVVPRDKIADFVERVEQLAKELDMRIPYFGHAGDGNLHIYFCRDNLSEAEWQTRLKQGFDVLYEYADSLGGLVSGEHGIGHAKREFLLSSVGQCQVEVMRGIKKVFDPKGILNPGKIV